MVKFTRTFSTRYASRINTPFRDDDFAKFNEQEGDIKLMQNQYKQMQLRLESMEQSQLEMQDNAR